MRETTKAVSVQDHYQCYCSTVTAIMRMSVQTVFNQKHPRISSTSSQPLLNSCNVISGGFVLFVQNGNLTGS